MATNQDPSSTDTLPVDCFDESITFEDSKPFENWEPSPRQIEEWSAIIRETREAEKQEDVVE